MADKNKSGDFYNRPEKLGAWAGFKQFLWNPDTSQLMGRTGGSWGKILLFYLIFYAVLTIFFMTMWFMFATTLIEGRPKYELADSLIGQNPGLGFRPMPPESNVESTLVWYEKDTAENSKYWVEEIDSFLKPFQKQNNNSVDCKKDPPAEGKSCQIDLKNFGDCIKSKNFGFPKGSPCIFLKLNKIYNWKPDYYENLDELPSKMPQQLKDHIKKRKDKGQTLKVVWVSCEGENPADIDNLGKDVKYLSLDNEQGFLGNYFPFMNTEGYLQPLVAVQLSPLSYNVLINIECKAWAKNINHDRTDRRGSVHFELMIDEKAKK